MNMNDVEEVRRLTEELAAAHARLAQSDGRRQVSATFLRLPALKTAVGMSRTAIYLRIKAGTFPKPIQIGARAVAWDEAEIAAWQQALTRGIKKQMV